MAQRLSAGSGELAKQVRHGTAVGLLAAGMCAAVEARQATAPPSAQAPAPAPPPQMKEIQPAESRLQFYGFIRQDVIFDSSRTDSAQSPLFVLSVPAGTARDAAYTMHPRLTRFGFNLNGPALEAIGDARIAGRLEIDFQNGGRDSRAIPRYRHAYMTLTWTSVTLLAGQTADVISPLFPSVNADTLMWNAGNLGDRRPQIRGTFQSTGPAQWSFAAAAGLTGAVDQQDLDADGVRDGESASIPTLQGRIGLTYPVGKRRLGAGVWVHASQQDLAVPVAGQSELASHAFGIDLEIPLGPRAIVRGEAWSGTNLADIRGGIGEAVNRIIGRKSTAAAAGSRSARMSPRDTRPSSVTPSMHPMATICRPEGEPATAPGTWCSDFPPGVRSSGA